MSSKELLDLDISGIAGDMRSGISGFPGHHGKARYLEPGPGYTDEIVFTGQGGGPGIQGLGQDMPNGMEVGKADQPGKPGKPVTN